MNHAQLQAGDFGMTGPEHYKEAEEAIRASTWQRQEWGRGRGDSFMEGAFWEMKRAQVHATLALAAATGLPPAESNSE